VFAQNLFLNLYELQYTIEQDPADQKNGPRGRLAKAWEIHEALAIGSSHLGALIANTHTAHCPASRQHFQLV